MWCPFAFHFVAPGFDNLFITSSDILLKTRKVCYSYCIYESMHLITAVLARTIRLTIFLI